jgi:hypothetical protein
VYNLCDKKFITLGRLGWAGHVMWMEECDPAKKVLCTKPGEVEIEEEADQS